MPEPHKLGLNWDDWHATKIKPAFSSSPQPKASSCGEKRVSWQIIFLPNVCSHGSYRASPERSCLVEYVVFVKPSALQLAIFAKILQQESLNSLISGSTARSLALINNLNKISNSPILLQVKADQRDPNIDNSVGGNESIREAMKLLPPGANPHDVSLSGK